MRRDDNHSIHRVFGLNIEQICCLSSTALYDQHLLRMTQHSTSVQQISVGNVNKRYLNEHLNHVPNSKQFSLTLRIRFYHTEAIALTSLFSNFFYSI